MNALPRAATSNGIGSTATKLSRKKSAVVRSTAGATSSVSAGGIVPSSSCSSRCNRRRIPGIRSTDRRRFKNAQQQQLRVAADDGDDVNAGNANNESNSTDDEKEYEMPSEEDPLPWSTPAASSADDDASNNAKTEEKPKILSYAERLNIMKKEKEEAGGLSLIHI